MNAPITRLVALRAVEAVVRAVRGYVDFPAANERARMAAELLLRNGDALPLAVFERLFREHPAIVAVLATNAWQQTVRDPSSQLVRFGDLLAMSLPIVRDTERAS